jgi:hypothetical protein
MDVACWCASLGYLKLQARRVYIPLEAAHDDVVQSLRAAEVSDAVASQANVIFGIVLLSLGQSYSFMQVYTAAERLQINFWEALLDYMVLDGRLFRFEVRHAVHLEQPVPLMQCGNSKQRGFVVGLEAGQADNLWPMLDEQEQALFGVRPPTVAVRLAPQHACLVVHGIWHSIFLPHLPRVWDAGARGGSTSMHVKWDLLGIEQPDVGEPPALLSISPELSAQMALEVADALRHAARAMVGDGERYEHMQSFVHCMQYVHNQLQPVYFAKMVKDLRNRASHTSFDAIARRRLKYNTGWLLKVFLFSDCLRNSGELGLAMRHALQAIVPPTLLPMMQAVVDHAGDIQPSKGTLSRWRLLLDGSLMLWHRRQNGQLMNEFTRYMQADSSVQHGRCFQIVCMQSIRNGELRRCFLDVSDLISTW